MITALRTWLVTGRLHNLATYLTPVFVGSALAAREGHLRLVVLVGGLVIASLLRQGIRFINDWEDFTRGVDRIGRLRHEHSMAQGLDLKRVRWAGLGFLAAALALTVPFALALDLRFLLVIAITLLAILAYAGGPWPFSHHALGEAAMFLFAGPMATLVTLLAHGGRPSAASAAASLGLGSLAAAMLMANNRRDVASDAAGGKRTLPMVLGDRLTRSVFSCLVVLPYALLAAVAVLLSDPWTLVPLVTLPLAASLTRKAAPAPRELSRLELLYGGLLTAALVIHAYPPLE